jgi:hypothetical protein
MEDGIKYKMHQSKLLFYFRLMGGKINEKS